MNELMKSERKKKVMIGIGMVVVSLLGFGALLLALKSKDEPEEKQETTKPKFSGLCKHGDVFPLRYGSCGKNVAALQRLLKLKFNAELSVSGKTENDFDGKFGNLTQAAVLKFLKTNSISEVDFKKLRNR